VPHKTTTHFFFNYRSEWIFRSENIKLKH